LPASFLFLALIPYALYEGFCASPALLRRVSLILCSVDLNCSVRALALATALAQDPTAARTFARDVKLASVKSFLKGVPDHVAYTAVRFLLAIAPALSPGEEASDVVECAMELPVNRPKNGRLSLVVGQFLAALPIEAKWTEILRECGVESLARFLVLHWATDEKIMTVARILETKTE
jgi:hypothetical protein